MQSGKHFVRSSSRVWRKFLLMFSLSHSPLLIGNNSTECRGTALDVALPEDWLKSVSNFVFPPLAFLLHISYTYNQMYGIHIFLQTGTTKHQPTNFTNSCVPPTGCLPAPLHRRKSWRVCQAKLNYKENSARVLRRLYVLFPFHAVVKVNKKPYFARARGDHVANPSESCKLLFKTVYRARRARQPHQCKPRLRLS